MNLNQTIEAARNVMRFKHMAIKTEKSYVHWIRRFALWCKDHPAGSHQRRRLMERKSVGMVPDVQTGMRQEWDQCNLTRLWWNGPEPVPGDGLRTKSGRQYLILDVRGKRLECLVLPKSEPIEGRVFEWTWGVRTRKAT